MIKGRYVFKTNGEVICEGENVITTNGSLMINRHLANSSLDWAGTLAVGTLGTTSASTDTKLGFEVYRNLVNLKSYVTTSGSNQLVIKASLDPSLVAKIYEVGIIPLPSISGTSKDNFIITSFSDLTSVSGSSAWATGTTEISASTMPLVSGSSRLGDYNISASATSVTTKNFLNLDVSNYNTYDYFELLYYVPTAGTSPSLTITLKDSASIAWTSASVNLPTTSSGFYSASIALSNSPATGFNGVADRINLTLTGGTGTIQYDALKLMSGAVKPPELKLVSRKSSSTVMVNKKFGQPVDVEYYLTVT